MADIGRRVATAWQRRRSRSGSSKPLDHEAVDLGGGDWEAMMLEAAASDSQEAAERRNSECLDLGGDYDAAAASEAAATAGGGVLRPGMLTRSRSRSFYEDDDAIEADLGAAVAAGSKGDKGFMPDPEPPLLYQQHHLPGAPGMSTPARRRSGSSEGIALSPAHAGGAFMQRTSQQLKPNELLALSQGLRDATCAANRSRRAASSDIEDEFSSDSEYEEDDAGRPLTAARHDRPATPLTAALDGSSSDSSSGSARHAFGLLQRARSVPPGHGSSSGPAAAPASSPVVADAEVAAAAAAAAVAPAAPALSTVPPPLCISPPAAIAQGIEIADGSGANSGSSCGSGARSVGGSGAHRYQPSRRGSPGTCRKVKILMLGDTGVGKSSLMNRFTEDEFFPGLVGTVGVDFKMRTLDLRGERVLVQVWDTAGQERFHKITRAYYRGSHGILLAYDVGEPATLENISYWINNIQDNASSGVCTCLVGNKMDLRGETAAAAASGGDRAHSTPPPSSLRTAATAAPATGVLGLVRRRCGNETAAAGAADEKKSSCKVS